MNRPDANKKTVYIQSNISEYEIIQTDAGDTTLYSSLFDENSHSTYGASLETKFYYVSGCSVIERMKEYSEDLFNILEVGTGIGTGLDITIETLKKNNIETPLHFISFELDEALIKWAINHSKLRSAIYPTFSDLTLEKIGDLAQYKASKNGSTLSIFVGDARETITRATEHSLIPKIHAIYQDPFSPTKNSTLWTVEWFKNLKEISDLNVILSTYSASSAIRKSLIEAKWIPENVPGIGKKRSATIARLQGKISADLSRHLERSPVAAIFDKDLQGTR